MIVLRNEDQNCQRWMRTQRGEHVVLDAPSVIFDGADYQSRARDLESMIR